MNPIIINSIMACAVLFTANMTNFHLDSGEQEALYGSFQHEKVEHIRGLYNHLEKKHHLILSFQEPEQWELTVESFSPAYYDKDREAIAVNTVEQPTDQWAAATTSFKHPSGIYTIRFTSLLESDGECSYVLRIGGKKMLDFQNPRIYGKDIKEYAPHEEVVENIAIEKGDLIRVEFLPHSNGMVPEGDGFGFARARWKGDIEFIPQPKK